jgi:hypothetical protein
MPHFGAPLWVVLSPPHCPDKKQLIDVKDFFKYTEEAGDASTVHMYRGSARKPEVPRTPERSELAASQYSKHETAINTVQH